MTVRIGIDTGGTFTDVVVVHADGSVMATKVPSTPHDPGVAVRAKRQVRIADGQIVGDR